MIWGLVGLALVASTLWGLARRAGRDAVVHLPQAADPFASRRAMMRYHAALRAKRP